MWHDGGDHHGNHDADDARLFGHRAGWILRIQWLQESVFSFQEAHMFIISRRLNQGLVIGQDLKVRLISKRRWLYSKAAAGPLYVPLVLGQLFEMLEGDFAG
jgi:hypothetical protein